MKILLFDDDKSSIDMLLKTIDWKSLGFDAVVVSYTVKQAKSLLIQNGPADIMILDIDAPGETGIDLLRWVREQGYLSENIFLTNYDSFAFAKEAMKLDCVEYILKMAPVSEIVEAVRRSIQRLENKRIQVISGTGQAPATVSGTGQAPATVSGTGQAPIAASGMNGQIPQTVSGMNEQAAPPSSGNTVMQKKTAYEQPQFPAEK